MLNRYRSAEVIIGTLKIFGRIAKLVYSARLITVRASVRIRLRPFKYGGYCMNTVEKEKFMEDAVLEYILKIPELYLLTSLTTLK